MTTSRRRFLELGATALAGTALAPAVAAKTKSGSAKLPPSIAKLKSLKGEAVPITTEERQQRVEKARRLMVEDGLGAIIITSGNSLPYFSGAHWWVSERFFGMVLPANGAPFFVCPAFEEDRAREQLASGPFAKDLDIRIWQEDEDPYARVAQGLKDRGVTGGVIGIEEKTPFVFSRNIAQAYPARRLPARRRSRPAAG